MQVSKPIPDGQEKSTHRTVSVGVRRSSRCDVGGLGPVRTELGAAAQKPGGLQRFLVAMGLDFQIEGNRLGGRALVFDIEQERRQSVQLA